MGSFSWEVDGEVVEIVFSLIRNGQAIMGQDSYEGQIRAIRFDYLEHEDIVVYLADLDIEDSEYDRDLWNMLLQVTNLDAS